MARLLLLLALGSCSFVMTSAPTYAVDTRPTCRTTMEPPALDVAGSSAGIATIGIGVMVRDLGDERTAGYATMIAGGVATIAYAVSAVVGYRRVKECRRAIHDYDYNADPPEPPVN